ncbi:MAG: hypothetical protein AAFQ63_00670 [Cyanobacteria bacterium J06621_11]
MFPFSFLVTGPHGVRNVCDHVPSDQICSDGGNDASKTQKPCQERHGNLDGYEFPQMSLEPKPIDHELNLDRSYHARGPANHRYSNHRYYRYQQMNQSPVWQTMPALSMRNLVEQFEQAGIFDEGCEASHRGVYADVSIGEYRLRLQSLAWSQPALPHAISTAKTAQEAAADSDLKLLLVLSPMADSYLPIGTSLTITENNLLHSAPHLQWASHPNCLYTQVFGDWEKKFTVKIVLPNALPKTLPSLTFPR